MSVWITNGVTALEFLDAEFQIPVKPPKMRPQAMLNNAADLPRTRQVADVQSGILKCVASLPKDDHAGGEAGFDSLVSFFESDGNTGVNQMMRSFMMTDTDGNTYQVRFTEDFNPDTWRRFRSKAKHYEAEFTLHHHLWLPSDFETPADGWWAAYDMDDNGGDLSSWTTLDDVGDTGKEWDDKSGNGYDGTQATTARRPHWTTSQVNGRPAIDFNVALNHLVITGFEAGFDGADMPMSAYAVVDVDTSVAVRGILFVYDTSAGTSFHRMITNVNAGAGETVLHNVHDSSDNDDQGATGDVLSSGPAIISVVYTGTVTNIYVNGVNELADETIDVGTVVLDEAVIGAESNSGTAAFDGRIGEVFAFPTAHDNRERKAQEQRLSDMWGKDLDG